MEKKPRFLPPDLQEELDNLERYWLRYRRAYNRLKAEIDEKQILLNFKRVSQSDTWSLNDALYQYVEVAISSFEWLKPQSRNKQNYVQTLPFSHRLLREWRNINHHEKVFDIGLFELKIRTSDGSETKVPTDWNITNLFFERNEKLSAIVREKFGSHDIATDATLSDLVAAHDIVMILAFNEKFRSLSSRMPDNFLKNSSLQVNILGGTFSRFIPKQEFFAEFQG